MFVIVIIYIADQMCPTGGFKKIMWIVVIMGMSAALIYNVVQLTRKYCDYPISVKLNVDHQQQLTFPSVAVCNMNPVKRSAWLAAQNAAVKHRRKRSAGTDSTRLEPNSTTRTPATNTGHGHAHPNILTCRNVGL